MSDTAIRVDSIGKQYRIGKEQPRYKTLRDTLSSIAVAPFKRFAAMLSGEQAKPAEYNSMIWALKDISFDVKQGERVGIIGRNGAGKSTLLKILSRITEPSTGMADISGRVSALLEVGTGFHAELTGRENIYLNGAILGMKRAEINHKFDEIVAFSEIQKFIDTPVKHYSSGMYLRLAFAVAAHLEPEILIVDEVLAVGDASFQKKCLGKMEDVSRHGRTILFVSHNLSAMTRLCKRAILLEEGKIIMDGPAPQVVAKYLSSGIAAAGEWNDRKTAPGNEIVRMRAVRVCSQDGRISDAMDIRRPVGLQIEFEVLQQNYVLVPYFILYNEEGVCLFLTCDRDPAWQRKPRPLGRFVSTAWIPGNFLAEGNIAVRAGIVTENPLINHCDLYHVATFQVVDTLDGDSARGDLSVTLPGVVRPLLEWSTKFWPEDGRVRTVGFETFGKPAAEGQRAGGNDGGLL
jgi:lipopolysaccharide transport system ATP-binding protein